ncbi:MAG TPA: efflux RND transporter periplasmic adaptor subunit [Bryobacteraceae bacterium]|nr:efflux RND transporter periplasmic adaptor subunit [Bryobacteraceae bacterium]
MPGQTRQSDGLPYAAAALLLATVLLQGCTASGQRSGPASAPPPLVTVMEVQARDVPIFSDFAAQTYARNTVEVRSRVTGYVDRWLFQPGAEVEAGQVLYALDLRPFQAAVEQARGNLRQSEADLDFARKQVSLLQAQASLASAEANLVKARQDHERLKPLVAADAASQQDLDAAVAALRAAEETVKANQATVEQAALSTRTQIASTEGRVESNQGALHTAELNLEYGTIRAPIGGRIGDSLVPVGGLVTPTAAQPLSTIVPLDPIWVRFKVTESEYLAWAKRGQQAPAGQLTLILADGSEFPSKGRVADTLNQVDPKTGTLELQASFPNPRHTLLPGQFGRIRVQVDERKNAIEIPQKAVQQIQSMQAVYTVGPDNKALMRAIVTGNRTGELWIVEQGLKPGERIIVEGQLKVRPGATVEPQPYREPKPGN